MSTHPDSDCAHLRGEYKPIIMGEKIIGSTLMSWCCDLDGCQSCGTKDCPTDRRYVPLSVSVPAKKYA